MWGAGAGGGEEGNLFHTIIFVHLLRRQPDNDNRKPHYGSIYNKQTITKQTETYVLLLPAAWSVW